MEWIEAALAADLLGKPAWMWGGFMTIVAVLLALDLGVLHRREHEIGIAESLWLSGGYMTMGLAFGGWVWFELGRDAGLNYMTGFVVEKSLALDNIFVISLIFASFAIPRLHQHRVLFWGILGAIVLRGLMIGLGSALIVRFEWILWLFGAFLAFTGVKMLVEIARGDSATASEAPSGAGFLRRFIRVTDTPHGNHFFVRAPNAKGRLVIWATPLFLCLVLVELADIVFAVDSVPAIFAITTDPFVVYTSNIFAILGLRALYFALAAMMHRFVYLKHALSLILIFIGGKIAWTQLVGKPDPALSLGVTALLIAGGIGLSLWRTRERTGQAVETSGSAGASGSAGE